MAPMLRPHTQRAATDLADHAGSAASNLCIAWTPSMESLYVSLPFAAIVLQFDRLGEKGLYLLNPRAPGMVLDMDGYIDPYEEVMAEEDSDNPDEDDSDAESNYKDKSFDLLKSDKHWVRNPDDTFRGPFCPCKKSRGTRARTSSSTLRRHRCLQQALTSRLQMWRLCNITSRSMRTISFKAHVCRGLSIWKLHLFELEEVLTTDPMTKYVFYQWLHFGQQDLSGSIGNGKSCSEILIQPPPISNRLTHVAIVSIEAHDAIATLVHGIIDLS
ncbi:hypothetical protein Zm00014a_008258 [Zea mays]|uniref:Uncharacterized protein n=1 Tax=Zea mays TaxID=4577 RepID=A0A3L6EPH0_MAIZE|nr:hypothetical protein Zm00014a_008258 [Zea mays]